MSFMRALISANLHILSLGFSYVMCGFFRFQLSFEYHCSILSWFRFTLWGKAQHHLLTRSENPSNACLIADNFIQTNRHFAAELKITVLSHKRWTTSFKLLSTGPSSRLFITLMKPWWLQIGCCEFWSYSCTCYSHETLCSPWCAAPGTAFYKCYEFRIYSCSYDGDKYLKLTNDGSIRLHKGNSFPWTNKVLLINSYLKVISLIAYINLLMST